MRTFGENLKKIRLERKLTASEVASKVGVSKSTYRDWEEGRKILGEPYLRIADALETSLQSIFQVESLAEKKVKKNILKIRDLLTEIEVIQS